MKTQYRIGILFTIFLLLTYSIKGQDTTSCNTINKTISKTLPKSDIAIKNGQKLHYSINFGAGYASGLGSFTNISPSLNYQFSPKLNFQIGGIFFSGLNNSSKITPSGMQSATVQNPSSYFIYTNGQYLLTNKLTVSGSFYKTINPNNTPKINPYFLDYKGMNLGLNYKLTQNINIGAQFHFSNGYNNLFNQYDTGNSPFSNF